MAALWVGWTASEFAVGLTRLPRIPPETSGTLRNEATGRTGSWTKRPFLPTWADVLKKMFPLLAFSWLWRKRTVMSSGVRLCKIMNTSIYYVFITTRSYVVTPTPVGPSCSPLDGDERHDHPLLHVSPGSSMSRRYCTVFGTETQLELYRQEN